MKFGVLINEGPYQHQASDTAYKFIEAAIEEGHEIFRVFFYHVLCVAAAQRRGMVDEDEMKRNSKDANNIAGKFRISGLGQLIEAGIQADRMITFGD